MSSQGRDQKIRMVASLAVTLVALTAPGTAQAAARIDSVRPGAALHGAQVELRGRGFGAKNVRVWVGGVAAQVLSATGNRVLFRVPDSAPVGPTRVEAANPGDKRASAPFTVLFDGNVTPVVSAAQAVSATIGREGGSLESQGVRLQIPAGALSDPVRITMTPLTGLRGSPLAGQVAGATFQPDGLALLEPATLTFSAPAGTNPAGILAFGFDGGGTDMYLVPHELNGSVVELEIWHFSGAGGHFGNFVNGVAPWTPGTAETQAEQAIALARQNCQQEEQANPGGSHPACDALAGNVRQALFDWYTAAVRPGLQAAVGAPSFQVEEAFEEWLRWAGRSQLLAEVGALGSLEQELDAAEVLATRALANLVRRRLNNCTGTDLVSQLRDVLRTTDLATAGAIDLTTEELPSAFGDELMRACASVKIETPSFPRIAARGRANELEIHAYIGTHTGARITNQPLELTLDVVNGDSDADRGLLDASGHFQTNVYPFPDVTGVVVEIAVELGTAALPGITDVFLRESVGSTMSVPTNARDRVELAPLAGASTTVRPGNSLPLKARVAGNDMAGASVTYSLTGIGQLSSTTGTANADGEAPTFDFTVPAGSPSGTATITATFGDASDSITVTVTPSIQVSVSPSAAAVSSGGSAQFTATVTGTPNTAVTWSAAGGSIGQGGLYIAGSTPGTFTVTATSVADPSAVGAATVTIDAPAFVGRYDGTVTACLPNTDGTPGCTDVSAPIGFPVQIFRVLNEFRLLGAFGGCAGLWQFRLVISGGEFVSDLAICGAQVKPNVTIRGRLSGDRLTFTICSNPEPFCTPGNVGRFDLTRVP